ncbi:tripartite tricarboxylate transporter TctB family protein [Castellaniella sp.]|uniref:tripartite tricarboxylate transporter TctB family protein n=1 Tax=Castellaniella sp. TaxID=1955812 RepID=UPI002AFEF665|nr:tripartite tricarboxylate transporter TctB family protein [Castellaniella sp.]
MSPLFRDRLGSLLMIAFIAVLWSQRDYSSRFGGLFPDTIMAIMALFVALTLILSFTPWSVRLEKSSDEADGTDGARRTTQRRQVLVVIILMALWTGLYQSVGFAITGTLGFAAIAWYLGDRQKGLRGLATALAYGALVSFVVYTVFDYFLLVPLPAGFLLG